jgi:hypothetical protein
MNLGLATNSTDSENFRMRRDSSCKKICPSSHGVKLDDDELYFSPRSKVMKCECCMCTPAKCLSICPFYDFYSSDRKESVHDTATV